MISDTRLPPAFRAFISGGRREPEDEVRARAHRGARRPDVIFSNHQICTCTMRKLHAGFAGYEFLLRGYNCSFVDRELEYEGSGNWNKNLTIGTVPEEELGKPGDTVSPHSVGHWAVPSIHPCG